MKTSILYIIIISILLFSCSNNTDSKQMNKKPDVYVVGYGDRMANNYIAMLWENEELTQLTDGKDWGQASSVFVQGNDVYISGVDEEAKYWKNGIAHELFDGNGNYAIEATAIFVK